jgi:hypothetical protein
MTMTVFWEVELSIIVELGRRFSDECCLHHSNDHETTSRHIQEGYYFYIRRRKNLKSHFILHCS